MDNQTTSEKTEIFVEKGENGYIIHVPENAEVTIQKEEEKVEKAPAALDNILTLCLVGLLALVVIIAVIRKAISNRKPAPVVEEVPAPVAEPVLAPGSAGEVKLHSVEPKTAAMLMAIVADKLQKPLNELRFISIKEVE